MTSSINEKIVQQIKAKKAEIKATENPTNKVTRSCTCRNKRNSKSKR